MMHAYLDNAATTPVAPEVVKAMMDVYNTVHGNPSSTHAPGRKAKALVETSRRSIAKLIGVPPRTVCFTSKCRYTELTHASRDVGCRAQRRHQSHPSGG